MKQEPIVALLGRRDEPTDGVADYCAWLGGVWQFGYVSRRSNGLVSRLCVGLIAMVDSPMRQPDLTDEERAQAVATLRAFARPDRPQGARDWAHRLRFRELSGERLSEYQRNAWREALHSVSESDSP